MTGYLVKSALPAALVTLLAFGNTGLAQEYGSQSQRSQSQRAQQSQKSRMQQARTIQGEVIGIKRVDVRGTDAQQLVVRLETPQGRRVVADLGSAQDRNLKNLGITLGDRLTVKGRPVRVGDRTVLAATQVRANGQTAQLDRQRQWQQMAQQGQRGHSGSQQQAQRGGSARQLVRELQALPTGRTQRFYRQALQQHGYEILDSASLENATEFEVEKNGQTLALTVDFDEETGRSTQIEAAPIRQSQAWTSRQQERRQQQAQRRQPRSQQQQMQQGEQTGPGRQVSQLERDLAGGEFLTQADRDLEERIWSRLDQAAPSDALENIRLVVDNGEVTLRGTVEDSQEKDEIGQTIERIRGVKAVYNQLRVTG